MSALRPLLVIACATCLAAGLVLLGIFGRSGRTESPLEAAAGALIAGALIVLGIALRM